MGFLPAQYIGLFVLCISKKINTNKEIFGRLITLITIALIHLIVLPFISTDNRYIVLSLLFWYLILYGWCIIRDCITLIKRYKVWNKEEKQLEIENNSVEPIISFEDLLSQTGKIFFIKYYKELKCWQKLDIVDIIEEKYTNETRDQRIKSGKAIFEQKNHIKALEYIINDPAGIDDNTLQKAKEILKNELKPDVVSLSKSDTFNITYINTIVAKTHSEFLKIVFNSNLQNLRKSICWYSKKDNIAVWMIRLYSQSEGNWDNSLLVNNDTLYVREKYIGTEESPYWNGKPITLENLVGQTRLIVEVEDRIAKREYRILGLFELCNCSTNLNRLYKKIPDNLAKEIIPEIFNN